MTAALSVISGFLHRRDGVACPPLRYSGRRLGEADLGAVIALHHRVLETVPAHLLAAESDAFFADHMARIGRIFGLFVDEALIAYGVLGLPGPGDANFGDDLGLPAAEKARVAHIDGISVHPGWRGNRLQRVLIGWRVREAAAAGRYLILCTVAPGNAGSLSNALAEGLTIRALLQKFGGWRYMMELDLLLPNPAAPPDGRWIDGADLETQGRLLAAGNRGWRMERQGNGYRVWFAPRPAG